MNATPREIEHIGGDFSLYRDWLQLSRKNLSFSLLSNSSRRFVSSEVRKVWEKAFRRWEPNILKRRLFLRSRLVTVPRKEIEGSQVLLSHLLYPFLAGEPKVPVVWSTQGISPSIYYERTNPRKWTVDDVGLMYAALGTLADTLLVSTESGARNIVRACPDLSEKIRVVHAPVFVEDSPGPKPSEADGIVRFLFVGLEAVRKGLPEVVQAFREVKACHNEIRLEIVSRPPPRLEREIHATPGANLLGPSSRESVKGLMNTADILLLPTYADTYALAAVEAMAHGCAVLISDLEPLPEVVPDGVAGFCIRPGDVGGLVEKMNALLKDRIKLRIMQKNARGVYRKRHHPDVVAAQMTAIFEDVLGRYGAVGARV